MRKLLVIVVLMLSTFLFGELDNFLTINSAETKIKMSNNCFIYQNNVLYFTYLQKNTENQTIIFSKSNNDGVNFSYNEIYSGKYLSEPNISIVDDKILIFFSNKNNGKMIQMVSNNDGLDFTLNENLPESTYSNGSELVCNNQLNLLSEKCRTISASNLFSFYNYAYFENGEPIPFSGYQEIPGRMHSNTDINLIHTTGNANPNAPGWSLFSDYVSVGGIINFNENPPFEQIFQEGYEENKPKLQFNNERMIENSIHSFNDIPDDNQLIYINMQGNSCISYVGQIENVGVDTLVIYDSYPPFGPVGDSIGVNYIPIIDTVWTSVNVPFDSNTSIYVPNKLLLKGYVSGRHSIYCEKSVYLIDDISYSGTAIGDAPDNSDNPNTSDYFGLVSNDNIIISYGYVSPEDGLRHKPNSDGIVLYGSYAAITDNNLLTENSVFTFEYQHPHYSTEACTYNGQLYDNIDLHLYKYPQTEDNPWPADIDYPYYNPLWPESAEHLVFERGAITLYGSVAQITAGYIHKSGVDSFNHSNPPIWDIPNNLYGTTHNPTGYNSNYHYDSRLDYNAPPNFCELENIPEEINPQMTLFTSSNGIDFNEEINLEDDSPIKSVKMDILNNYFAIVKSTNSGTTVLYSENSGADFNSHQINETTLEIINVKISDKIYILAKPYYGTGHLLLSYNPTSQGVETLYENYEGNLPQNINLDQNNNLILAKTTESTLDFYELQGNQFVNIYSKPLTELPFQINDKDKLNFSFTNDNHIYLVYNNKNTGDVDYDFGDILLSKGILQIVNNHHDEVNPIKSAITNYPNPFVMNENNRGNITNFKFSLNKNSEVEINIYNLKGQKIARIIDKDFNKGEHIINWNLKDNQNKMLSSGIYLYEYKIDGKINSVKKFIIIK